MTCFFSWVISEIAKKLVMLNSFQYLFQNAVRKIRKQHFLLKMTKKDKK